MRRVIGTAGLSAALVAACGTARAQPAVRAQPAGCAAASQATVVVSLRATHLVDPMAARRFVAVQTGPAVVRALLRDLCQVTGHPRADAGSRRCPGEVGVAYSGTFYAGRRVLATYTYEITGCEVVSLSAGPGWHPVTALVPGAAPRLHEDLARAVGKPAADLFGPPVG